MSSPVTSTDHRWHIDPTPPRTSVNTQCSPTFSTMETCSTSYRCAQPACPPRRAVRGGVPQCSAIRVSAQGRGGPATHHPVPARSGMKLAHSCISRSGCCTAAPAAADCCCIFSGGIVSGRRLREWRWHGREGGQLPKRFLEVPEAPHYPRHYPGDNRHHCQVSFPMRCCCWAGWSVGHSTPAAHVPQI